MRKIISMLTFMCFPIILNGCAFDVISVEQVPAILSADKSCNDSFVLAQDINIQSGVWYSRTLKKGTRWNCVGKIPQGNVYNTQDQILTVEASNVFEAYIVVLSSKVIGFYLPVEAAFSPLDTQTKLVTQQGISDKHLNH